jgi:hypothetical protein
LNVRALLDGYQQREEKVLIRSRQERIVIDLSPLPNSLVAFAHNYFAGRGSLTFLTKEALTFRVQKRAAGINVVLTETGLQPEAAEAMQGIASALVESVRGQQLGEDLVVRVDLTERGLGDFDARSRQDFDAVRNLHRFALDLVPKDGGAGDIERARQALASIGRADVSGCALEFDDSLRRQLDPADLARALSPSGSYTDKFMRAAMKRLGEVSEGGVIHMRDGSEFHSSIPIELMAAASQPADAIGYLALLRSFVAELEPPAHRRQTLQGLVAPELSPASFERFVTTADQRESTCLGRAPAPGGDESA